MKFERTRISTQPLYCSLVTPNLILFGWSFRLISEASFKTFINVYFQGTSSVNGASEANAGQIDVDKKWKELYGNANDDSSDDEIYSPQSNYEEWHRHVPPVFFFSSIQFNYIRKICHYEYYSK